MKLADLAREIDAVATSGRLDREARDVTHDSRGVAPGSVFVAIRGAKTDAHRFIPQVIESGAVAIISELSRNQTDIDTAEIGWIQVSEARAALARAAAAIHGHPSRRLKLVGVTGTNGKTTTAHLVDSIIRAAEGTSAMFGTIQHRVGDQAATAHHTTPEAADIQRMLAQAVAAGCRSAVMEVSSHAIELHRADGLKFAVAVFSNLTRDHLDYHQTMESYFAAKAKLFNGTIDPQLGVSAINIDDEYGRRLLGSARGRIITYGFSPDADVRTDRFDLSPRGLSYTATTPAGQIEIASPLVGRFHVYNTLAAIGAGLALGAELEVIAQGIRDCRTVAGRFEQVTMDDGRGPGFAVIVDYAHTDDALKNVLQTAREVAGQGRVITVFGCGGDRDRTKRAPMGEIAAMLSDVAIVTSDNPRGEAPLAIIADVEVGLQKAGREYVKLPDRREAIFCAINEARDGDVVVIAGKGHETYQILGDNTIHFDDKEVAREAMTERRGASR
ncbi:MAG TPA: UDP-N-acetylmuramoyl-L-alanyl-D-glutamate--2,6-diaminopimelate ligase [Blastocatellia bacterium]|nr:UDP-N-acetylmuramoyl-L-alanyl-D-glutamate--2,6-diaminopimelate ligase [Blastocatellia bacterium]